MLRGERVRHTRSPSGSVKVLTCTSHCNRGSAVLGTEGKTMKTLFLHSGEGASDQPGAGEEGPRENREGEQRGAREKPGPLADGAWGPEEGFTLGRSGGQLSQGTMAYCHCAGSRNDARHSLPGCGGGALLADTTSAMSWGLLSLPCPSWCAAPAARCPTPGRFSGVDAVGESCLQLHLIGTPRFHPLLGCPCVSLSSARWAPFSRTV